MPWCPNCNEVRESGSMVCPECGVELNMDPTGPTGGNQFEATKSGRFDGTPLVAASDLVFTCPKCGRKFSGGTKFCPEDGAEVLSERALAEAMQKSGTLSLSPAGLVQKKFSLLPDEKIILETRNAYYYEYSLSFKAGSTCLTQFRLVFCNNHSFLLPFLFASVGGAYTNISGYGSALGFFLFYFVVYGILIARKPTKINFQIPISQIKSITKKKFGFGSKYTFVTDAGLEYVIQFIYKQNEWESALRSLDINIQSLTRKGKPVDMDRGEPAAPETAGPTESGTAATSPGAIDARDLARQRDWAPVLILIAVMLMVLGASVYFWRSYQPAPPKQQEVKKPVDIRERAAQGDAKAQFNLGVMYYHGRGVEQDFSQAKLWFEKAAAQGHAKAQNHLGDIYYMGRGVEHDFSQAKSWFEKAAAQGYAKAQFYLGFMYSNGKGVEQDFSQAKLWYEKAAAQGDAAAQNNLGVMYYNGRGVTQDFSLAKLWFEKAAAQGDASAQNNLGDMYYKGRGVEQDFSQAKLWFEKAAAQGHAKAKEMLNKLKSN